MEQVADLILTLVAPDSIKVWEKEWRDRAALAQLEVGLREAIKHRGKYDREAAGGSLEAVLGFLYDQPHLTADGLHRPLFELWEALRDLEHGGVAAMLKPVKRKKGRPLRSTTQREARGHALLAVEQLIKLGVTPPQACQKVAQVWSRRCRRTRGSAPEWKTVLDWFNDSLGLPKDDPEREVIAAPSLSPHAQIIGAFTKAEVLDNLSRTLKTIGVWRQSWDKVSFTPR